MLKDALLIAQKDLRLCRSGLVQAILLGLLLIFVFSLSQGIDGPLGPQAAAAIFWLASMFCQVLIFNSLYSLEEGNGQRQGLLLAPIAVQSVWLGKGLAGLLLLLAAQSLFLPSIVVFLGKSVEGNLWPGFGIIALGDLGMVAVGSLLGAISQGQASKESLLSLVIFPLLIPVLLAGIRVGTGMFSGAYPADVQSWFGLAAAFDAMFLGAGLFLFGFLYNGED